MIAFFACAYALAYFALLPRLARGTSPTSAGRRAGLLALVHAAILLPVGWGVATAVAVLAAAVAHVAVDELGARLLRRVRVSGAEAGLAWIAAHLAVVVALTEWWGRVASDDWSAPPGSAQLALLVAILAFNGHGAGDLVGAVLATLQSEGADAGPKGAGRRIGMLERWIVVVLVAMGEWGAVGLVLTAKSVARFKKMDDQAFAETYLVGTMTSVLIAMATGLLLRSAGW